MRLVPWPVKPKLSFKYSFSRFSPYNDRPQKVCFRGSDKYTNKALSFQRLKRIEKLKAYGTETKTIKYSRYMEEIRDSKLGVIPFCGGEIRVGDFEIILGGTLLFKTSMDHLETFPNLYIDNETYVSFKCDFSNLEEKLDDLLLRPQLK